MDLSGIEGLSESQLAGIQALHDENVSGLKAKNSQLMDEAKGAKTASAEKDIAVEEARKVAADESARALEAQGKYEEAQKMREDERAKLVAEANTERDKAKATLDKYHLTQAKSGVKSAVLPEFQDAADALLNLGTSISYSENGDAVTTYTHGGKEFGTHKDFLDGVADDPMWGRMLKGADSGGAGTKQSSGGGSDNIANMTMTERSVFANQNPEAYASWHAQQN